jgi:hypothetical protein
VKAQVKRRLSRKPESAENDASTGRRERCVYDGQRLLGTFVENERSGLVLAWDAERKPLGRFGDARAAADAISDAARAVEGRKAASAEALEWLNPLHPEFKSGWPEW